MNSTRKATLGLIAVLALSSCTVRKAVYKQNDTPNALSNIHSSGISVSAASLEQCPSGGHVYNVYVDQNANSAFDTDEAVINTQIVCNGANGQNGSDGLSTLFLMTRVATNQMACASLKGLQIDSGLDSNRSGQLDPSEITSTQILCDGANGATGAAGPAGSNGYSMVFKVIPASLDECSAGGVTILMALDINRDGVFSTTDLNPQSISTCNGVAGRDGRDGDDGEDGADGADGEDGEDGQYASLPAYTPVAAIYPCGNTSAYAEVLLRLQNGLVLSSFSDNTSGKMTRFTFLPDGQYMTTDNLNCRFQLYTSDDRTTRAISWSGQIQQTWQISY